MPTEDVTRFSELASHLYPHAEILQVNQAHREFRYELGSLAADA